MNYLDILAAVLSAKPPRQQMPDEQQYGSLAGAIEPALAMGTGAAGQMAGGYAGLQDLAGGGDVESSVNKINTVKKALQYEPRMPQGRESLAAIAKVLSPVAEKIEQGKRFLGDNMQDAGYGPGVSTAAYMAPDILASALSFAKLGNLNSFKNVGLPKTQSGVMTYHGSPHEFPPTQKNPLGEFDLAKMGTGEGAQVYGKGAYLAENPEVGRGYGNLYKVDLPDEYLPKMLDWDKPLKEQTPDVRAAVQKAHEIRAKQTGNAFRAPDPDANMESLIPTIGEGRLQEAGIVGVKYFDAFSREKGEGTRNYVLFDPSIANIIGRE